MEPTAARLITERIQDIEREASRAALLGFADAGRRSRPAWRRHGGAAARQLSRALADLAGELDPTVQRRSYGRE